jgi:MFS family permease
VRRDPHTERPHDANEGGGPSPRVLEARSAASSDTPQPAAAPAEQHEEPPRSGWQLLFDRTFGPYFAGKLLSTIGVWVHNIAAAIVVWELTRSAFLVGAVSVGQFLPQLILTPLSGAHADRGDRRRQIILGRFVTAAGSLGLVVWSAVVGLDGTVGAAAVIVAATVVGIGFAVGGPAMQALLPALVRPAELPTAIAVSSMPFTIARASGPAIGAVLVASVSPSVAFSLAAATNLLFAAIIWRLPIRHVERPASKDSRVRAGWRYVRSDAAMTALLLGVVTIGFGADPVITLTPSIAADLGAGSSLVGVLASAFGVGAGLAFVVLGRVRTWLGLPTLGTTGIATMAVGMATLAAAPTQAVAVGALLLAGAGMTFSLTSLTTLIQQQVPEDLRGRVMALWAVAFLGSRPIAAATSGSIADATSATVSLLLVVAILVVGAVVARPSRTVATGPTEPSTLGPQRT